MRRMAVWSLAAAVAACAGTTPDQVSGPQIASVSITPPTTTLSIGSQAPLQASVRDASGNSISGADVFWSVQDATVATVSSAGVVTGLAIGSTQVAASSNGKSGIATITVQKIPVSSVVVTPPHVDASPGGKAPLSATAYDAAQNPLTDRFISWSTSNAAVATVDANGIMTATGQGTATITATSEGKSGVATVSVSQAAVSLVTVAPSPLSMSVGQTTQLTATLTDSAGNLLSGRTVTWASSNTAVATVSSQGVVTAVAAGSTSITATSEGKNGSAALTISNVAVGSVAVQPQGPAILVGANVQLSATVRDVNGVIVTNRVVTWSSSSAAVAVVSSSGVVTGVGGGTATITATSEGKSGTTSVTVTALPVATVTIQPPSPDTVFIGYTTQLTAVTKDSLGGVLTGRAVTWHSTNTAIATVDANGLVTGVAAGSTSITATSEGKTGTATLVSIKAPVGSVVVAPASDSVSTSGTLQLRATVTDVKGTVVTDRAIAWASLQGPIATISPNNGATTNVDGKAKGTASIVATSETKADTATVNVVAAVKTVTVSPLIGSLSLATHPTIQLTATCKDAGNTTVTGRVVTWTSSNPAAATVDANGLVTAKGAGIANITATAVFDGVTSVASVITVTP
ncbi:MAG TPA: Ig-like domain-containing protein [Gemmatimonadaceae bacterium]|nr:Ig-like domain-containing protein [Gemmatimonadaceae bacterium]